MVTKVVTIPYNSNFNGQTRANRTISMKNYQQSALGFMFTNLWCVTTKQICL